MYVKLFHKLDKVGDFISSCDNFKYFNIPEKSKKRK